MQIDATHAHPVTLSAHRGMHPAFANVFRTSDALSPAMVRVVLAAVLFPHGAQHLLGWFGGYGFAGTYHWMAGIGFPGPLPAIADRHRIRCTPPARGRVCKPPGGARRRRPHAGSRRASTFRTASLP